MYDDKYMKYNGCGAIIVRDTDDKVFVAQRKLTKSFGAGQWETIGGGLEDGENCEECIRREIQEELSAQVSSMREFRDYVFNDKDRTFLIKTYIVFLQDNPKPNANDFENWGWFSKEEIMDLDFVSNCKERILDYFKTKDTISN